MFFALFSLFLIFLTIPIKLDFKGYLGFNDKKIFFSSDIFGFFNILSGFINFSNNRLILRLKKHKCTTLKYKDLLPDKVKTDFIRHFDTVNFHSAILFGGEFNEFKAFTTIYVNSLSKIAYQILKYKKPYLKFKNDVFLLEENEPSAIIVKTTEIINFIAIIQIIIKKLYGGIYNYVKGKIKQQNT